MKLFKKKDKTNNSLMTLLKKLKRHDTMVVAIAVVIALMLCGGLIYISTPVVAAEAKEEFIESERENNELTKEKLQEIRDYLDELDKVVTNNQKSLSSLDEKASNTKDKEALNDSLNQNSKELSNQSQRIKSDTQTIIVETEKIAKETETIAKETEKIAKETEKITGSINEKVSALDGKLSDVHKNINETITRIDNVKTLLEEANNKNAKELGEKIEKLDKERADQLKKDFEQISGDLEKINNDYNEATAQTKDLLAQLEKNLSDRMDADTEKVLKNGNDNSAELHSKLNDMYSQMQSFNTGAFADFRNDISGLSSRMDEQLNSLNSDIKNYNTEVKNKFDSVNNNVTNKLDEVNSSVSDNFKQINETMNSQTTTINKLITASSSKSEENNKAIEDKLSSIESTLGQVFQRVSKGKENMASTLLTYNVTVEPDASFEQFSTAIDELGKQKTNRDTVVSKAKANATADKILAGQTIEIDDLIIEGTATSDADASAGTILSGSSAYVNGQKVYGEVPIRSMGNVMLTSSNNTQHFEAGYYEAFTVTADAATLNGQIRFQIGHTHTGDERSGRGCYTTVDESRSWSCGAGIHLDATSWRDGSGVSHHDKEGDCYKCGQHYRLGPDAPDYITCGRGETYYLRSCGHEEGDFIRETDDINDVGENEKLLSATISMD